MSGFNFMHNYISTTTKNVPTLSDIMKKAQTSQKLAEVKTASYGKNVKTAEMPDFIKKKIEEKKNKGKKVDDKDEEEKDEKACGDMMPAKASAKATTKKVAEKEEAETSGQLESKANPNNFTDPKAEGESKSKGGSKGKSKDEAESSGQLDVEPLHQKGESTGEKPAGLETQKEKKSSSTGKFVRVAALTGKQKEFLRRVWSIYWPKSFIDAFLARA